MRRLVGWVSVFAFVWFAFAICGTLSAQAQAPDHAGIQGTVIDPTGAPIPHAKITATNTATAAQTTRESNGSGDYSISSLPPGNYTVEATARGFMKLTQTNVKVEPKSMLGLQLKLMVGTGGGVLVTPDPASLPLKDTPSKGTVVADGAHPKSAAVPLFRDPIHDGAADPVVVYNRARKTWWMLYTNRRADLDDNSGVTWVHGTRIGIAESSDGSAHWKYVSEADIPVAQPDYTLWAPEVIDVHGTYHMFLTVVPGTFTDWKHPRHIQHLTSKDLLHWTPLAYANLQSESTIDACVFRLPSGEWRLWYKNEADSSKVYFSDSPDLVHWTHKGIATTNHGEGPVVFQWHGAYYLINDPHAGLAVFRSDDLTTWHQQPQNILREPGTQPTDRAMGNHADVVLDATGRAWLFYFTHQGGADDKPGDPTWRRRTFLHVTELHEKDGILTVDRNAPADIHMLPPPKDKKSDGSMIASAGSKATARSTDTPIHVASDLMAEHLIKRVLPVYPRLVDEARGAVVLRATISKEGDVTNLTPISGPAMLRSATIDAVKQWKYKPYVVNKLPVDVDTTITIQVDYGGVVLPDKP